MVKRNIELIAWVVLPDHFHMIVNPNDRNLSDIIRQIKQKFAGTYRSRHQLVRGRLWQHRFWDHIIRDQDDLNRHIDYIHYNPVKHGLVRRLFEYEHSSLHKFAERGCYQTDWGTVEAKDMDGNFGE